MTYTKKDTEIAWLAGLFDGEGSIAFGNGTLRPHSIRLRIVLESRDKFVIEKACEVAGVGVVRHRNKPAAAKEHWSDQWEWDSGRSIDNYYLLQELIPFLVLKRDKALLALEWLMEHATKVKKEMEKE